ncbi:MAG: 50S ribosomal protein L23 [Candidatus Wenzhouxiangella sp. M2_3B_020]
MARDTLIRPLVTEKTTQLMEQGKYAFVVDKRANKTEIRQAIEREYPGAKVAKVRTMIQRGRLRRQFTKSGMVQGRTPMYKKAIVSLKPDSAEIDFFENI